MGRVQPSCELFTLPHDHCAVDLSPQGQSEILAPIRRTMTSTLLEPEETCFDHRSLLLSTGQLIS